MRLWSGKSIEPGDLETPPESAGVAAWIDHAALLIVAAESGDHPSLRPRALAAALTAVERAPASPIARYNLAFAFELLGARRQARAAWAEFTGLEENPEWIREAESRLRGHLSEPSELESWRARPPPAGQSDWAAAAAEHPQQVRTSLQNEGLVKLLSHLEDGVPLPRWMTAAAEGIEASSGDSLLRQAFGQAASCSADCEPLARAISELLSGREQLARRDGAATATLGGAFRQFNAIGSPLALWASYHRGVAAYFAGERPAARALAISTEEEATSRGYVGLAGRAARLAAVVDLDEQLPEAAIDRLNQAVRHFEQSGETGRRAAALALIATCQRDLGQPEEEWAVLAEALRQTRRFGDERRLPMVFGTAALSASELGEHRAALALIDETMPIPPSIGNLVGTAESQWWRATILEAAGELNEALTYVAKAKTVAEKIENQDARRNLRAGLFRLEGEILYKQGDASAAAAFSEALAISRSMGLTYPLADLHHRRARVRRVARKSQAALADLNAALAILEEQRRQITERVHRIRFFDQARPIYETIIEIAHEDGKAGTAFAWADHGRARELEASWLIREDHSPDPTPKVAEMPLRFSMPPGDHLLVFELLEEKTLIWSVTARSAECHEVGLGRRRVDSLVDRWLTHIIEGDARESTLSEDLFDHLLRPVLPATPSTRRLVFVPDESLARLPFHILRDPGTGRRLIEEYEVLVSPSAHLAELGWRSERAWSKPQRLVAAAAPGPFPDLPSLPLTIAEVEGAAGLYEQSVVIPTRRGSGRLFLDVLGRSDVAHFAGHAQAASGIRAGLLHFSAEEKISLRELAGLKLDRTRLIVLSGCETHRDRRISLDGPVTLASALISAQAQQVLATLWKVQDDTAFETTLAFHGHVVSGGRPSRAFQRMASEMLASQEELDWAGFQLIGVPMAPEE